MIQSVDRAARVLHLLASGEPSLGLADIAAATGLAKPTVHGLLRTMTRTGLIQQDPATGRYGLGPRVLELGNAYLAGSRLRARSILPAARLAAEVGEKVWVGELVEDRVLVVHHEFRPDDTVAVLEVGATLPWYASALGHAIVAHADRVELTRLLAMPRPVLTARTRSGARVLRAALVAVRRDGVAHEDEEASVGDAAVAAPVFGAAGRVVGSLGVVGPVDRVRAPARRVSRLEQAVQRAAAAVSRDLGAR